MTAAIYPGTFDPVTHGHLDVIARGSRVFDRLVVAVARNLEKDPWFPSEERVEMLRELVRGRFDNVEVEAFDGLIVEFARSQGARCLLRGLRNVRDFDDEVALALSNRDLAGELETVFLLPSRRFGHVSGRLVREVAALGGDLSQWVPPRVEERLRERVRSRRGGGGVR